ncbi:hypothetical protein LguiB_024504 [Lonicera macranthoides]
MSSDSYAPPTAHLTHSDPPPFYHTSTHVAMSTPSSSANWNMLMTEEEESMALTSPGPSTITLGHFYTASMESDTAFTLLTTTIFQIWELPRPPYLLKFLP